MTPDARRPPSLGTRAKRAANRALGPLGLRLDSRTAERLEDARLAGLVAAGAFDGPAFPVPDAFRASDPAPVFEALALHAGSIARLAAAESNDVGFALDNPFFPSPDAEVLYAMVRRFGPARIVEVGSGHSTRVARQAARDAGLATEIVSIDPAPRRDVAGLVDRPIRARVETAPREVFDALGSGDVLFVDSSHEIRTGNDVVHLFLRVLPDLAPGVVVHVHDVFLPWDYPVAWVVEKRRGWTEQYLVQALLAETRRYEVLWAGHWLSRTRPDFAAAFPHLGARPATSLWLRVR